MAEYKYTFTFTHVARDNHEEEITVTVSNPDREYAKSRGREKLAQRFTISQSQIQNEWELDKHIRVGYADEPWDSFEELDEQIRSIDGAGTVRVDTRSLVKPVTFYITPSAETTTDEIQDSVEDYYDGLVVEGDEGRVKVMVDVK